MKITPIFLYKLFGSFNKMEYFCGIKIFFHKMTEIYKRYRLTSQEEPTDEMLQALMEDVAKSARNQVKGLKRRKNVVCRRSLLKSMPGVIASDNDEKEDWVKKLIG